MSLSEKQIQIIQKAETLFARNGYDGTTVRDIADAAGVNLAMISYYFGSKEGLMRALFEMRAQEVAIKTESLLHNDALTPMEKIFQLVDDYIDRIDAKLQFHKVLFMEQVMEKNGFITGLLNDLKKRNTERIAKLIAEGQEKGKFRKDVDLVLLMSTLFGTVTHAYFNRSHYKSYHKITGRNEAAFNEQFRQRIRDHIKTLFKALLENEA